MIELFLAHKHWEVIKVEDRIKGLSGNIYEIQERISSGGNAVVHKCQRPTTGDVFAIKFQLNTGKKMNDRFNQEINLLKTIEHKQLIRHIDSGEITGTIKTGSGKTGSEKTKRLPFLIMELAEKTLTDHLYENEFKISYAEYIGQFKGLALALATLHEKAIHRDIKPENILINGDTWLLSDFGLCKYIEQVGPDISRPADKIGPKYWMSPESLNRIVGNSDDISKQSDVYQLCAIYWYVVTGRVPAGVVCEEDWTGSSHLFKVLFNSLSHDPKKRPQDGKELFELLNEVSLNEAFQRPIEN